MFRFAILVAGAMAMSDPTDMKPSCSERGKAYVTADKISSGPDGLYVINAISCQQSCAANPTCKKFTWKGDTTPLKGGCWLVSDADAEVRDDPMAISGPRLCPAAASSFRRSGPIAISDMGKSGAKDLHDADSLGGKDKTLVAGASTVSKRSDAATFLLGLLAIAGVVGAIFGIAGATYFLAARKPKKTRALKAAPQDEERPIMDETRNTHAYDLINAINAINAIYAGANAGASSPDGNALRPHGSDAAHPVSAVLPAAAYHATAICGAALAALAVLCAYSLLETAHDVRDNCGLSIVLQQLEALRAPESHFIIEHFEL